MSSINTNIGAMNALNQLRSINDSMSTTQDRISSGLKISSGKDNAAYFSISETMKGDNGALNSIKEGLTLTSNSVKTARLGAESFVDLANQFAERVAFAQGDAVDRGKIQDELNGLAADMATILKQSTFNGNDLVNADGATPAAAQTVVTGVTRAGGFAATTMTFQSVDLDAIQTALAGVDVSTSTDLQADMQTVETQLGLSIDAATSLGIAEKSIESQQGFLEKLTDNIESGVGSMVDANMEEEAARLKAVQTQQQLATQALTIANNQPQQLLALFR